MKWKNEWISTVSSSLFKWKFVEKQQQQESKKYIPESSMKQKVIKKIIISEKFLEKFFFQKTKF